MKIVSVKAREIIDSRGNPTVEAVVKTKEGCGRAASPSGASTGKAEALELRDGGRRFFGKGVLKAVGNVNSKIARLVVGSDVRKQKEIDGRIIAAAGKNKSKLGANATTAVSLAVARCAANSLGISLFAYLNKKAAALPVPMLNVINGGKHAGNGLAVQEFMLAPVGAKKFSDALEMGCEVYHALGKIVAGKYGKRARNVGDEGGYAPQMKKTAEALDAISKAIDVCGHGKEVFIALDSAATSFWSKGAYAIDGEVLGREKLIEFYERMLADYSIVSFEDPLQEDDFEGFAEMSEALGGRALVVGDDLFASNPGRIRKGIRMGAASALLLKVNQIGTLTEAIEAAELAKGNYYKLIVSNRSGETEDSSIADLAVALGAHGIKAGAPARGERTAKYNQLIRIEEELGKRARYVGRGFLGVWE